MFTSFSTALSALSAFSTAIDVVGHNLANLNTAGFKANTVSFHDLVTQTIGAGLGESQVGFGVGRPATIRQFTQGAVQASSSSLDAAIQGDGFFIVKDYNDVTKYTRAGNFQVDMGGNLLTATGERLQGWMAADPVTGAILTSGPVGDISLPIGSMRPATPTTSLSMNLNLDATASAGPPPGRFSSAIEVYDSLGVSHVVTIDYSRNATANTWDYSISVPDADLTAPFTPVTGTLTFDSTGQLVTPAAAGAMPQVAITGLADGAADMTIDWQLYDGAKPRLTQYAQASAVSANAQNGNPPAQLLKVGLGDGGKILAQFSSGQQTVVGQVALASIRNPESLVTGGNNTYLAGAKTALPAIGVAGTGGRGTITGSSIEYSTVDISTEFTNLIVYQRGYQANARVVTTVDEMSQDTINLKR